MPNFMAVQKFSSCFMGTVGQTNGWTELKKEAFFTQLNEEYKSMRIYLFNSVYKMQPNKLH